MSGKKKNKAPAKKPAAKQPATTAKPQAEPVSLRLPYLRYGKDTDPSALAERALFPLKFDSALYPQRHDIVGQNLENRKFLAAVEAGFVPKTVEGFETLAAWIGMGWFDHDGPTLRYREKEAGRQPFVSFEAWLASWDHANPV